MKQRNYSSSRFEEILSLYLIQNPKEKNLDENLFLEIFSYIEAFDNSSTSYSVSLQDLISKLQSSLTNSIDTERYLATLLLAKILLKKRLNHINNQNIILLLLNFFLKRLSDFPSILPCFLALEGIFLNYFHLEDEENDENEDSMKIDSNSNHIMKDYNFINQFLEIFFSNFLEKFEINVYSQDIREKYYDLLYNFFVIKNNNEVMISNFTLNFNSKILDNFLFNINGEKDPRCLYYILKLINYFLTHFSSFFDEYESLVASESEVDSQFLEESEEEEDEYNNTSDEDYFSDESNKKSMDYLDYNVKGKNSRLVLSEKLFNQINCYYPISFNISNQNNFFITLTPKLLQNDLESILMNKKLLKYSFYFLLELIIYNDTNNIREISINLFNKTINENNFFIDYFTNNSPSTYTSSLSSNFFNPSLYSAYLKNKRRNNCYFNEKIPNRNYLKKLIKTFNEEVNTETNFYFFLSVLEFFSIVDKKLVKNLNELKSFKELEYQDIISEDESKIIKKWNKTIGKVIEKAFNSCFSTSSSSSFLNVNNSSSTSSSFAFDNIYSSTSIEENKDDLSPPVSDFILSSHGTRNWKILTTLLNSGENYTVNHILNSILPVCLSELEKNSDLFYNKLNKILESNKKKIKIISLVLVNKINKNFFYVFFEIFYYLKDFSFFTNNSNLLDQILTKFSDFLLFNSNKVKNLNDIDSVELKTEENLSNFSPNVLDNDVCFSIIFSLKIIGMLLINSNGKLVENKLINSDFLNNYFSILSSYLINNFIATLSSLTNSNDLISIDETIKESLINCCFNLLVKFVKIDKYLFYIHFYIVKRICSIIISGSFSSNIFNSSSFYESNDSTVYTTEKFSVLDNFDPYNSAINDASTSISSSNTSVSPLILINLLTKLSEFDETNNIIEYIITFFLTSFNNILLMNENIEQKKNNFLLIFYLFNNLLKNNKKFILILNNNSNKQLLHNIIKNFFTFLLTQDDLETDSDYLTSNSPTLFNSFLRFLSFYIKDINDKNNQENELNNILKLFSVQQLTEKEKEVIFYPILSSLLIFINKDISFFHNNSSDENNFDVNTFLDTFFNNIYLLSSYKNSLALYNILMNKMSDKSEYFFNLFQKFIKDLLYIIEKPSESSLSTVTNIQNNLNDPTSLFEFQKNYLSFFLINIKNFIIRPTILLKNNISHEIVLNDFNLYFNSNYNNNYQNFLVNLLIYYITLPFNLIKSRIVDESNGIAYDNSNFIEKYNNSLKISIYLIQNIPDILSNSQFNKDNQGYFTQLWQQKLFSYLFPVLKQFISIHIRSFSSSSPNNSLKYLFLSSKIPILLTISLIIKTLASIPSLTSLFNMNLNDLMSSMMYILSFLNQHQLEKEDVSSEDENKFIDDYFSQLELEALNSLNYLLALDSNKFVDQLHILIPRLLTVSEN